MIVWEVALGDYSDARPEDRVMGGVMVCNLPIRHTVFIESRDQTGMGTQLRDASFAAGRELGLTRPCLLGCIRASTKVSGERLYREIQKNRNKEPH